MNWKQRYKAVYEKWQLKEYPEGTKDFGTLPPNYPDVRKSNGLIRMICNFLRYEGWRATRINTMGRIIGQKQMKSAGGDAYFNDQKWIPGTTRKGTADVSATINGRSVMLEIKTGQDKPSDKQLREQQLERQAGGIYEFVHTAEEFFELYDKIIEQSK